MHNITHLLSWRKRRIRESRLLSSTLVTLEEGRIVRKAYEAHLVCLWNKVDKTSLASPITDQQIGHQYLGADKWVGKLTLMHRFSHNLRPTKIKE
jgi:hypothetical protein